MTEIPRPVGDVVWYHVDCRVCTTVSSKIWNIAYDTFLKNLGEPIEDHIREQFND